MSSLPDLLQARYQFRHCLGKVAGRQTWLAQDLQTQQPVVVKLLTFGTDFQWDDLKLFEREAAILKAIDHPAIPRYLDSFELNSATHKGFALIQSYIAAPSLEAQLQTGRSFSAADLKQLATELLQILNYLHALHPPVIHRDIKPSNILLSNRSGHSIGAVYLVDFGSVQTLAAKQSGTITVVGTYGYMPPEQFGGRATPASDLYSLGATLIYLATGQHPADLPQVDLKLQFEAAAQLSPTLTHWLQQMVEPSLNRRFTSAQAALDALIHPSAKLASTQAATQIAPSGGLNAQPFAKRPMNSRIQLHHRAQSLDIVIPPEGFSKRILSRIVTLSGLFVTVIQLFNYLSASQILVITPLMITLPFLWLAFILTSVHYARRTFIGLCQQIRLHLDAQRLELRQDIGRDLTTTRSCICGLSIVHRPRWGCPSGLIVWVGTEPCKICDESIVSQPELEWLAQELSHWLGVPIFRDK